MKILAVASVGGHWIQLMRLKPAFEGCEIVFASTQISFAETVIPHEFYEIRDFSRKNRMGIIKGFVQILNIVRKVDPDIVITTGAAPGLIAVLSGKLLMKRVIWVDSIANIEQLSMSGKYASYFADRIYTQWPNLATGKIIYAGNILS